MKQPPLYPKMLCPHRYCGKLIAVYRTGTFYPHRDMRGMLCGGIG